MSKFIKRCYNCYNSCKETSKDAFLNNYKTSQLWELVAKNGFQWLF